MTMSARRCASIWPLVVSIASMRDDLAVVACGTFSERPEALAEDRLFALPAPEPFLVGAHSALRDAARQVAEHLAWQGTPAAADGHLGFRTSIASLAVLLQCNVEGIEVGASSSSRTLAGPSVRSATASAREARGLRTPVVTGTSRRSCAGAPPRAMRHRLATASVTWPGARGNRSTRTGRGCVSRRSARRSGGSGSSRTAPTSAVRRTTHPTSSCSPGAS